MLLTLFAYSYVRIKGCTTKEFGKFKARMPLLRRSLQKSTTPNRYKVPLATSPARITARKAHSNPHVSLLTRNRRRLNAVFSEVLSTFFSRQREKVKIVNHKDEAVHYRPSSAQACKVAHLTILSVVREPAISSRWKYANVIDALRLIYRKNASLDHYVPQDGAITRSEFHSCLQMCYRLPPGKTVSKALDEAYNAFYNSNGEGFDLTAFRCYMYILSRPKTSIPELLLNLLKLVAPHQFLAVLPSTILDTLPLELRGEWKSGNKRRVSSTRFLQALTKPSLADSKFLSLLGEWVWDGRRPSSRAFVALDNLGKSMANFQYAYERTKLEVAYLTYCMAVKKKHFRGWWAVVLDIREIRRLSNNLLMLRKRLAVRKFIRRTATLRYLRWQREQAQLQYLFFLLERWRRRARGNKKDRLRKLMRLERNITLHYFSRVLINEWNDAAQEAKGLDLARPYFDSFIKKKWLRKWKVYTHEQIRLLRVERMRLKIREAEDAEAQKDVDEQEEFFLTEFEQKQREIRLREKAERLEKERLDAMWAHQRDRAKGAIIKVRQENERIQHKQEKKEKKQAYSKEFFEKMAQKVTGAAEKQARDWLLNMPEGLKKLKQMVKEVFEENQQEARMRVMRGEGRVYDSDWLTVIQEGIAVSAPIAYTNAKTLETFLFSGMKKKLAKQIAISNFLAEARFKAKSAFDEKQKQDEIHFYEVDMATRIQAKWRMKLGWRAAEAHIQRLFLKVYDAQLESSYYYNTRDRIASWEKPQLLGRWHDVKFFSMWQVKFDHELQQYVYYHRKKPWDKFFCPPSGLIVCEACNFYFARQRCRDMCCINNDYAYMYTCFKCYDETHSRDRTNSIVFREVEEHKCTICKNTRGACYCRGCNGGDVFCKNCFVAIHSRPEFASHGEPIEIER